MGSIGEWSGKQKEGNRKKEIEKMEQLNKKTNL